jgi:hypothetical protein
VEAATVENSGRSGKCNAGSAKPTPGLIPIAIESAHVETNGEGDAGNTDCGLHAASL